MKATVWQYGKEFMTIVAFFEPLWPLTRTFGNRFCHSLNLRSSSCGGTRGGEGGGSGTSGSGRRSGCGSGGGGWWFGGGCSG